VQTDSTRAPDLTVRFSNLTVTAVTSFLVLWSRRGEQATAGPWPPCAVHLTHRATAMGRSRYSRVRQVADPNPRESAAAGGAGGGNASRVRIDSLVLTHIGYPPDQEWNYSMAHWSVPEDDKQTMRRFLERHGGTCV